MDNPRSCSKGPSGRVFYLIQTASPPLYAASPALKLSHPVLFFLFSIIFLMITSSVCLPAHATPPLLEFKFSVFSFVSWVFRPLACRGTGQQWLRGCPVECRTEHRVWGHSRCDSLVPDPRSLVECRAQVMWKMSGRELDQQTSHELTALSSARHGLYSHVSKPFPGHTGWSSLRASNDPAQEG